MSKSKSSNSIKETYSPAQRVLVEHAFGHSASNLQKDLDTEEFFKLIHCHRLISLINHNYHPQTVLLKEQLDQAYYINKLEQLRSLAELIRIDLHLKDEGIAIVPLKGHILSQLIYQDPTERTSRDIDILVRESQVENAVEILLQNGYKLNVLFDTPKQRKAIIKHYHNLEFHNEEEGFIIELHWRISSSRSFRFDLQQIWDHSELIEIGESSFRLMRKDDLLAYLCVHGTMHSFFRLHWLADIYYLIKQLDEKELTEIYSRLLNSAAHIYLLVSIKLLHVLAQYNVPSSIQSAMLKEQNRVDKICAIALREIKQNTNLASRQKDLPSRFKRMIYNHRIQYLTGGTSALLKSIFGRNVRPQNWKIFVFPDSVFFLNHLFSRLIWLVGKLAGRI